MGEQSIIRRRDGDDRTCGIRGCGRHGSFRPVVLFWAVGWARGSHAPMRCDIRVPICEDHRHSITAADLIDDRGYEQFAAFNRAAGKLPPCRETADVEWVPLGSRFGPPPAD